MPRVTSVLGPGHRRDRPVVDTVILDYAQRSAQKITVTGVKGGMIEIDPQQPAGLRTDDLLLLDDGTLVEVVAAPESLIEARTTDVAALARLAWHLATGMCRCNCWQTEFARDATPASKLCSHRSVRK